MYNFITLYAVFTLEGRHKFTSTRIARKRDYQTYTIQLFPYISFERYNNVFQEVLHVRLFAFYNLNTPQVSRCDFKEFFQWLTLPLPTQATNHGRFLEFVVTINTVHTFFYFKLPLLILSNSTYEKYIMKVTVNEKKNIYIYNYFNINKIYIIFIIIVRFTHKNIAHNILYSQQKIHI